MASVPSLDKDLRNLRLDKYTPQRANEVRQWIEGTLGEKLPAGDLLEALKDGTALCKLINTATPGGVRFKQSAMPFVQMENISHFLRACQSPPLSLPAHDCFLTVDLYEAKDPAQVLQCIESFSRSANAVNPARIKTTIGGRKGGTMSPQGTGTGSGRGTPGFARARGTSNASESSNTASGRISPTKAGATSPSSSWANRSDIGATAPAWNIAQYGWTGGASQGNQGIAFGARRQITSTAPQVPSLADKERRRREKAEEEERLRQEAEQAEKTRRAEREAEEARARAEEERRWEEETAKRKEEERKAVEEEKRIWEQEERKWREEEEMRARQEKEEEARLERQRQQKRAGNDDRLRGQFLSQYQAEQKSSESDRIKELERQLEEAKERERKYEQERQRHLPVTAPAPLSVRQQKEETPEYDAAGEDSFQEGSEREYLLKARSNIQTPPAQPPRPVQDSAKTPPAQPPRPLPVPQAKSPRPLPNPATYTPQNSTPNRTDRFLSSNPAPAADVKSSHIPSEAAFSSTSERDAEDARRVAAQQKTKAGGWASKSLLEREMEKERERQREWEEAQKQTKEAAEKGKGDPNAGSGPGQSWDIHSYGWTGGDNMNKGAQGVYAGRRQLVGPRPLNK